MSVEGQIGCLTGIIAVGANRFKKAHGMDHLMFIGNTLAGKSTKVNSLHGLRNAESFKQIHDGILIQTGNTVRTGVLSLRERGTQSVLASLLKEAANTG
jgi:hypothetical protein